MMAPRPEIHFERVPIPASVDADDAGAFVRASEIRNEIARENYGNDDDFLSAQESLPYYLPIHTKNATYGASVPEPR